MRSAPLASGGRTFPRRLVGAVALGGLALLAACSGGEAPPADDVIPDAAAAMAEVQSVRFDLAVDGSVDGLSVKAADGVVTADGDAEGTGTITVFGAAVEIEYVIVGEDAYVKGFTGGFQQIPVGDDMLPYNPTILLAPDQGIAALLEAVDSAEPQDAEKVDGTDAYRYEIVFDPEVFGRFIPAEGDWNTATVWFDQETSRVLKAEFAHDGATVTIHLSDYDEPVTIEAP
ncbi:LppX_LprAFG lipoprotein [Glycomyces sp. NRRL B-16210]|uniref:LppX_LprAFG lipoprotein n=1 Tax=Glycomyces sp. NRRL B-16210 TaxID=1463821 RepID=UPI0004C27531|nr:LppX_LprAFG lipoprotein [Glycomyces sp. NRRL B-16210]